MARTSLAKILDEHTFENPLVSLRKDGRKWSAWRGEGYQMNTPYARWLWMKQFGAIPEGHHIHHKDGDKTNDCIENLECIPESQHIEQHAKNFHTDKEMLRWHRAQRQIQHEEKLRIWAKGQEQRKETFERAKRLAKGADLFYGVDARAFTEKSIELGREKKKPDPA